MSELRNVDLSDISDEDLTEEQKEELQRRFDRFFKGLARAKYSDNAPVKPKKVRKWVPGQK